MFLWLILTLQFVLLCCHPRRNKDYHLYIKSSLKISTNLRCVAIDSLVKWLVHFWLCGQPTRLFCVTVYMSQCDISLSGAHSVDTEANITPQLRPYCIN